MTAKKLEQHCEDCILNTKEELCSLVDSLHTIKDEAEKHFESTEKDIEKFKSDIETIKSIAVSLNSISNTMQEYNDTNKTLVNLVAGKKQIPYQTHLLTIIFLCIGFMIIFVTLSKVDLIIDHGGVKIVTSDDSVKQSEPAKLELEKDILILKPLGRIR